MWRLGRGHRERTWYRAWCGDMGWYYVAGLSSCIMLAMMMVPGNDRRDRGRESSGNQTPEEYLVS